jgi:hypothetical protein
MSQATTTFESLLEAERQRLRQQAGLVQIRHFRRPEERAFTPQERDHVTILFGGLTWKHEELSRRAMYHSSRRQALRIHGRHSEVAHVAGR